MNYPVTFYHDKPRLTCTKYRRSLRRPLWHYGTNLRLLGHATLSIDGNGQAVTVLHLENRTGEHFVVIPDDDLDLWLHFERTWSGSAPPLVAARFAINAYLHGTVTPPQPERVRSVA